MTTPGRLLALVGIASGGVGLVLLLTGTGGSLPGVLLLGGLLVVLAVGVLVDEATDGRPHDTSAGG
jgi:hypothetical protein